MKILTARIILNANVNCGGGFMNKIERIKQELSDVHPTLFQMFDGNKY